MKAAKVLKFLKFLKAVLPAKFITYLKERAMTVINHYPAISQLVSKAFISISTIPPYGFNPLTSS